MRRGCNLAHLLKQLDVFAAAPELVIADEGREGCTAEDAELFFVNLLEERALVELRRALQIAQQVALGDVQHLDLEHVAGFAVIHQVLDAAPGAFELLERLMVQHFVQLHRDQPVDLRNARANRGLRVARERHVPFEDLVDEFLHHVLAALLGCVILAKPALRDD